MGAPTDTEFAPEFSQQNIQNLVSGFAGLLEPEAERARQRVRSALAGTGGGIRGTPLLQGIGEVESQRLGQIGQFAQGLQQQALGARREERLAAQPRLGVIEEQKQLGQIQAQSPLEIARLTGEFAGKPTLEAQRIAQGQQQFAQTFGLQQTGQTAEIRQRDRALELQSQGMSADEAFRQAQSETQQRQFGQTFGLQAQQAAADERMRMRALDLQEKGLTQDEAFRRSQSEEQVRQFAQTHGLNERQLVQEERVRTRSLDLQEQGLKQDEAFRQATFDEQKERFQKEFGLRREEFEEQAKNFAAEMGFREKTTESVEQRDKREKATRLFESVLSGALSRDSLTAEDASLLGKFFSDPSKIKTIPDQQLVQEAAARGISVDELRLTNRVTELGGQLQFLMELRRAPGGESISQVQIDNLTNRLNESISGLSGVARGQVGEQSIQNLLTMIGSSGSQQQVGAVQPPAQSTIQQPSGSDGSSLAMERLRAMDFGFRTAGGLPSKPKEVRTIGENLFQVVMPGRPTGGGRQSSDVTFLVDASGRRLN